MSIDCLARALLLAACLLAARPAEAEAPSPAPDSLLGHRFFTLAGIIRVNQIEVSRDRNLGEDESALNTPAAAQRLRTAFGRAFPGGHMTWALSWRALNDPRPNYRALRRLVATFHWRDGDEVTFIPGAYFAPMYNTRDQVDRDLHDGLQLVSKMVGRGYRPRSVVAGFLSAANLQYLAEHEGIHVCQGNIWSQFGVDNGDGDGSICYPYYPSTEHFCKPAQGPADFIDCVNLDGWTCDFLCARYVGYGPTFNSRLGLGPIESVQRMGTAKGVAEQVATTAVHFDDGFKRNGFAWVTCNWEVSLPASVTDSLPLFGAEVRRRWPDMRAVTVGEFGSLWRKQFPDNSRLNYTFQERGTGYGVSDPRLRIRWYMNRDFRLALLEDLSHLGAGEKVIDFTRYDVPAHEPQTITRNWSLLGEINQKHTRPQDEPVPLSSLPAADQALILKHYPGLRPLAAPIQASPPSRPAASAPLHD